MKKIKIDYKALLGMAVILFVVGIVGVFTYKDYIVPESEKQYESIHLEAYISEATVPLVSEEGTMLIEQDFLSSGDMITGFVIPVDTQGRNNENPLKISLYQENHQQIQSWDLTGKVTSDVENLVINLDTPIQSAKGQLYCLEIEESDITADDHLVFVATQENRISSGSVKLNGKEQKGDLCFTVNAGAATAIKKAYIAFFLFVMLLIVFLVYMIYKSRNISRLFICFGILFGVVYLFLIPAYSAPDEDAHIMSAYEMSNKMMFQKPTDENGIVMVREEDNELYYEGISLTSNTYISMWSNASKSVDGEKMVPGRRKALTTPFYTYLAPAIGISIARILHLNGVWLLFLARFMNLLSYILLTALGIRLLPFHKMTMFVIGLLPMSVSIAASCSYDALNNGLAFAYIGYMIYMVYEKDQLQTKDWIISTLILILLAPIKAVYVFLAILCLLIPKRKLKRKNRFGLQRWIPFGAGMASLLVVRAVNIMASMMKAGKMTQATSAATIEQYSIGFVLQHPFHTVAVLIRTVLEMSNYYFTTMIGGSLGAFRVPITEGLVWCFVLLLFYVVLTRDSGKVIVRKYDKCKIAAVSVLCIAAAFAALLFSWTGTDSAVVNGLQGRYFLPVLPLLLMLFEHKSIEVKSSCDKQIMLSLLLLQSLTCLDIMKNVVKL